MVLHTALDHVVVGDDVIVPVDASGPMPEPTESAALRQIEKAGGTVTSVAGLITGVVCDFTTPTGRDVNTALHHLAG
ncbi:hypothetical protein [Streptomyces sp. NPDC050392]|uniref:hypothetical protein n=1 Tax=Streptomyces sp. NPDC050392 TaxID=3155782 RepID=UPI00342F734A